jgi:hypothetical protein
MPATVLATTVVASKLNNGDVLLRFMHPNGSVRFEHSFLAADVATINGLTSGNSATFTYAQDQNRGDYDQNIVQVI